MKYNILLILTAVGLSSCFTLSKTEVDLIIHNAEIHTMNEVDFIAEAIAVKDGIIIQVAAEREIMNAYKSKTIIDAKKRPIFPGFINAYSNDNINSEEELYKLGWTFTQTKDDILEYENNLISIPVEQINYTAQGNISDSIALQHLAHLINGSNDLRLRIENAQLLSSSLYDLIQKNTFILIEGKLKSTQTNSLKSIHGWLATGVLNDSTLHTPFEVFENNLNKGLSNKEALQAITIWAALATKTENSKGSLEEGKSADFVILNKNILKATSENSTKIEVLKTVVSGKIVFE